MLQKILMATFQFSAKYCKNPAIQILLTGTTETNAVHTHKKK